MTEVLRITGLSDDNNQLLALVIEKAASEAADKTMKRYLDDHCRAHQQRTAALEHVLFGRAESGADSLRDSVADTRRRVETIEGAMEEWQEDRRWMKRAVAGAVISAIFSVVVALLVGLADGII